MQGTKLGHIILKHENSSVNNCKDHMIQIISNLKKWYSDDN